MKKLVVFLSIVFVLGGCGGENKLTSGGENLKEKNEVFSMDSGNSDYTPVDECLKGCDMLNGAIVTKETCQGSCWAAEAKEKKDAKICEEKIAKDNGLPRMACYLNIAEETGETKYCENISDNENDMMVDSCYSSVAKKHKKPELCEGIKGSMFYETCVAEAKE